MEKRREDLPERVRRDADHLIALRYEAQRCARAVAQGGYGVVKTRYHGDYRLEQVLVVGNDFQIIDFEGDPARPLAERRTKHSPLRDVAGMLLSLDRAARFVLANLGAERAEHLDTLESLSRSWGERARRCFLEGYAERARGAASYPENEERVGALVELFMLEKALQEIHRQLEDRPEGAGDPIRGLIGLLERKKG